MQRICYVCGQECLIHRWGATRITYISAKGCNRVNRLHGAGPQQAGCLLCGKCDKWSVHQSLNCSADTGSVLSLRLHLRSPLQSPLPLKLPSPWPSPARGRGEKTKPDPQTPSPACGRGEKTRPFPQLPLPLAGEGGGEGKKPAQISPKLPLPLAGEGRGEGAHQGASKRKAPYPTGLKSGL